jgi:two-component system, response regulator
VEQRSSVLIVEDNLDDERLTLRALKRSGIDAELVVVRDGQQAWDYLLSEDLALPDFVLLDLKLPKMNGHEVLERVRACRRTQHIRVVVFTSSTERSDVERSYALGANSYVSKPVAFDEFMQVGQRLGSYWVGLNRCPYSV